METSTHDSRSRRGGAERAQREADLLAAAQKAFVTHGYHGASMDHIASLAGVSKPIVYQFFSGKLELYQELVALRSRELFERLSREITTTEGVRERIVAGLQVFFRYVQEDEESFLLLADSGERNGPPLRDAQDGISKAFTDFVAPLISAGGIRSVEEGRLIGRGVSAACSAVGVEWLRYGKETPGDELAADVADVAWNGLRRRLGDEFTP